MINCQEYKNKKRNLKLRKNITTIRPHRFKEKKKPAPLQKDTLLNPKEN